MLNRAFIHLSLIVLFAFTQIGITAHQISHFAEHQEQQQDQNSHEEQCGQCITYNHLADADISQHVWLDTTVSGEIFSSDAIASFTSRNIRFYGARAPPLALPT